MTERPEKTLDIPASYMQVLAHYYRAEVYRSCIWRTRLDVTTNWAILAMTAAFSWAFTSGNREAHVLFPITSCVMLLLLIIEARRFRFYDVWWTRTRLLEGHLVVPALNPDLKLLQGNWREFLSNDLLLPTFKLSFWEAIARRLANIYIYLFLILFLGWIGHVYTGADADGNDWVTIGEFLRNCRYRFLHPVFTILFQVSLFGVVAGVLLVNWKARNISGEIRRKDPEAPNWPV